MAFTDYFNQVQDLYIAYYQRPADPAGLIYWSQMANQAGGLTTQIINAFATSQEAQNNYGTITSANIGTVINTIYEALFNRSADAAGLAFYENGFNNGTFTPGTIALNILNGAQGNDLITLDNKLAAANQFTQALDPALSSGSASQLTATYDGADITSAKAYLAAVTADPTTLYTSGQTSNYIVQYIALPTDPIITNNTDYYNFTTGGIDHFVGASPIINIFEGSLSSGTIQAGDSAYGPSSATNTLQIYGNGSSQFPLSSLTLTNIQNVNISGDGGGLNFSGTSGIVNLTSTAAVKSSTVSYTLNGQNVSLNNDSGKVIYTLNNTAATTNLTINNIGNSQDSDTLQLSSGNASGIATLNLNVSGTNYVGSVSDLSSGNVLTTLNISGASGASLGTGPSTAAILNTAGLTTLSVAGAGDVWLDFAAAPALSTVNAATDAGNLYLDFSDSGSGASLASGFTFTGGTSPTTALVFTSSELSSTTFGTITPGSGTNILGINDGSSGTTIDSSTGSSALVNNINNAFAGFNTLDILSSGSSSSGNTIYANLLTHIDNYYIDNANSGGNTISGLTSADTVSILSGGSSSTDTLSLSGTGQTLHVNIGMNSTFDQTSGLTVGTLSTSGDLNVALNSYGSGTGVNVISKWYYASTGGSTADHNITIGGNYDLTASLYGNFSGTGAVNNVFDASSFNGASQTGFTNGLSDSSGHLDITDYTSGSGSSNSLTVNNLFIAPTNTTMSLTDKTSIATGASGTVNVYFDVHNAAYGNLAGGLVDNFSIGTHDYLFFDANAVGLGVSINNPYGSVSSVTVNGSTLAQDLAQIDALGHANTLYQFSISGIGNYIVDTGASTSTINDDIVVLIGGASAIGQNITAASANGTTAYHAVAV